MATEVIKHSVFDPRIVQTKPKYAVEKGALSLTNVSFNAQTASSSTCQFNVQVPSENVFVDRAVDWLATQVAYVDVTISVPARVGTAAAVPAGTDLSQFIFPAAFPLHQSTTQMSATINDATVTVNTQDVLAQILRLADLKDARRQRTTPTLLDKYAIQRDTSVTRNGPQGNWDNAYNTDEVPNSAFNGFAFCTSTGDLLNQTSTPVAVNAATDGGLTNYSGVNGVPVTNAAIVGNVFAVNPADVTANFRLWVRWQCAEKLVLPPFIFGDEYELSTGLFGVQNFQVQMNLAPTPARSVRVALGTTLPTVITATDTPITSGTALAYVSAIVTAPTWASYTYGPFKSLPQLSVQFLTPALDVPLPPKSVVPYMEFPRYISTPNTAIAAPNTTGGANALNTGTSISSNTITLPNIPDLIVIYAKPTSYADSTNGDWSLPIQQISMNFDNFSGLLANHTQYELYKMSINNGLDMDWSEWSGLGRVTQSSRSIKTGALGTAQIGNVGLVGGPLVLRPGRDFALQAGQAPGLVGNFTLQFSITVGNQTGSQQTPAIYVIPISSGFFETIKGSSRIVKGVLTESDILTASAVAPSADLERLVGEGDGAKRKSVHMSSSGPRRLLGGDGDGKMKRKTYAMNKYM